jgi:SAM-dependent methyltransferase
VSQQYLNKQKWAKYLLTLDVGSGAGMFSPSCLGDVNVDIGKVSSKPAKPFIQCDAAALPFRENLFTRVTMFDVLEHVDAPCVVLREIKRVMAKNGVLVLGTPNAMRVLNFLHIAVHGFYVPHSDHIAVWGRMELINLFKRVGFSRFTVRVCTYGDTKHNFLATSVLRLSLRQDLTGRQLLAIAKK